jgi:uncharacterized membrane protein YfcA
MAAYSSIERVPCDASAERLAGVLREEWGFGGTVVSDGRGIEMLADGYGIVGDRQGAGVAALTAGIDVGSRAVVLLDGLGAADRVIGLAYVGLLGVVGAFTLWDARQEADDSLDSALLDRVRSVHCPPMLSTPGAGSVSVWIPLAIGGVVGTLSGFLGVGGGFLLLPALLYGLGVPAGIAIGTDILQITISGAFGTFAYARLGAVSLPVAGSLLVGSAFGARVGAAASTVVEDRAIKASFAAVLLAGSLSMAVNELGVLLDVEALLTASVVLLFGTTIGVSALVVGTAIERVLTAA